MHTSAQGNGSRGFMMGLFARIAIGAGLAMLLRPRTVVSGAGDPIRKGQAALDEVAHAAAHRARKVERLATVVRAGRVRGTNGERAAAERAKRS